MRRMHTTQCRSYAYGRAFAESFSLISSAGAAIESSPNRPLAINPHFRVSFDLVYKWKYAERSIPTG